MFIVLYMPLKWVILKLIKLLLIWIVFYIKSAVYVIKSNEKNLLELLGFEPLIHNLSVNGLFSMPYQGLLNFDGIY